MRYKQVKDNEWIEPNMDKWYWRCCDCGLVHKVEFEIDYRQVRMKFTRVKRSLTK